MKADPVRRTALDILIRVAGGQELDDLLDRRLDELAVDRDRAFLAELVLGTLQWQGRYDHLIARFARRKPPTDLGVLNVLRLSLHQLLGQDRVPAFAALHQAGELCRTLPGGRRAVGFVNGVLQSVRREVFVAAEGGPADTVNPDRLASLFDELRGDFGSWCAAWHSHPPWLVARWIDRFGPEATEAVCDYNNQAVPLALHVLEPGVPEEVSAALRSTGLEFIPGVVERSLLATSRPARRDLRHALEADGRLIVQDATVQAATTWLLEAVGASAASGTAVDMCAAPGGKAARLAAVWPGPVVAVEKSARRLDKLRDTAARLGDGSFHMVRADGLAPPFAAGTVDLVLLDGPCSGTGVLRHHPDGRWRLTPAQPRRRGEMLLRLARAAVETLVPGGCLLYGTCSLEPEENEMVVERLLAEISDLETIPDSQGRWRRLWLPHETGGDGFFAARLRRRQTS